MNKKQSKIVVLRLVANFLAAHNADDALFEVLFNDYFEAPAEGWPELHAAVDDLTAQLFEFADYLEKGGAS